MQVRLGWSGETESNQWQKADITVDETDLDRMLVEAELPTGLSARLPTKLVYQLMQNEAELLLLTRLLTVGYPADKANARIQVVAATNNNIIEQVKKQLFPVPE